MLSRVRGFEVLAISGILYVAKFFLPVTFLTDVAIFSIYVLAFDLLYGYMGWLSFGHMLYLGVGAYSIALFLKFVNPNGLIGIPVALLAGAVVGLLIGPVVLRRGGAYFALVNLAFNEIVYFLLLIPLRDYTGGNDGTYFNVIRTPIDLADGEVFFVFVLLCLFLAGLTFKYIIGSPFGFLLRAIKENEVKVAFLGYNPFRIKYVAFIISTVLSAFAGALYTLHYSYVAPSFIDPLRSAEVVIASLLGGPGTFFGAYVGAAGLIGMKDLISMYTGTWELVLGIVIIIIMYRFKRGIWGYVEKTFAGRQ